MILIFVRTTIKTPNQILMLGWFSTEKDIHIMFFPINDIGKKRNYNIQGNT